MTDKLEKENEDKKVTNHRSMPERRPTKTIDDLNEEYDDWDESIHTYTGRRHTPGRIGLYRKARSYSFSEQPTRRSSKVYGTAKDRARSKKIFNGDVSQANRSRPSSTSDSGDKDAYKAVNDYYYRHPASGVNEKNQTSVIDTPDYNSGIGESMTNRNNEAQQSPVTLRQFHRSIYWLVHNRRKYGFRHVCMLVMVLLYTLLGAAIFFNIEAKYERKEVAERKLALDKRLAFIARQLIQLENNSEQLSDPQSAEVFLKSAYILLLKEESLFKGSTYHKSEKDTNYKWNYASAIFFCMNLYTTTGYGSIAPESMMGQICAIIYSLVTVPITLVVVRDLGQWVLVHLTKLYANVLVHFRRTAGYTEPSDDTMISLPIKFCLLLLAGSLLFASVFVYIFDEYHGDVPQSGVSFFTAFYFSYISISTIGLGDIMPYNATFHPAISTLFFFCLPVMKVVNRTTYICIENGVFGAFTLMESSIDQLTTKVQPQELAPSAGRPSRKISRISKCSYCSHLNEQIEEDEATDLLNNLTIRSLAAFARANSDVYGGGFGRVNLRKGDLVQSKSNLPHVPTLP